MLRLVFLLLLLSFAGPALASDGVLEINQTCAVQTGCFGGDAAGFPVTIDGSSGRSYRLTSDLIVPNENTDGIVISVSDVGIDLNNFAIIRSGCEGSGVECAIATSGTGNGIRGELGVAVSNGSVVGMGSHGIALGREAFVTKLRVRLNRHDGINAQSGSIVVSNISRRNGESGISSGDRSVISGNNSSNNGSRGIVAGAGSTVIGNSVTRNSGLGIAAQQGSTVVDNAVSENTGDGIEAEFSAATIRGNTLYANGGWQLDLAGDVGYSENTMATISGNTGTVKGGVNAGGNVCNGSLTCP